MWKITLPNVINKKSSNDNNLANAFYFQVYHHIPTRYFVVNSIIMVLTFLFSFPVFTNHRK